MSKSPNLLMPFIMPAQAQKHVAHNEALELLDALVHLRITKIYCSKPPLEPIDGQIFHVGSAAIGAFQGHEGELACYYGGGWMFVIPRTGFCAWVDTEEALHVYQDGTWKLACNNNAPETLEGLGVNATWDEENRISVSAQATLLSHEGGDHQLKINKARKDHAASLVFQTNFSGRAEIGLVEQDDLSFKVSNDGYSWTTAFSVDAESGRTSFAALEADQIGGSAVQNSPIDTTPGRLMRADWGYSATNVVGTVSEQDGLPMGALVESNQNERGYYVRWADGTQHCTISNFPTAAHAAAIWHFPMPFSDADGICISITSMHSGAPRLFACDQTTAASVSVRSWSETGNESVSPSCSITAIGRWY